MNEDLIKSEILNGLLQVDDTFAIVDFYTYFDPQTRKLKCSFVAQTESGEEISEVIQYA